jgi:hypothetical protein
MQGKQDSNANKQKFIERIYVLLTKRKDIRSFTRKVETVIETTIHNPLFHGKAVRLIVSIKAPHCTRVE